MPQFSEVSKKRLATCHPMLQELMNEVIYEIKTGNLFYLKRNDSNFYVNCQNEPINLTLYADKWFIPKCLIKTNL
jgi:hypothetical protein